MFGERAIQSILLSTMETSHQRKFRILRDSTNQILLMFLSDGIMKLILIRMENCTFAKKQDYPPLKSKVKEMAKGKT